MSPKISRSFSVVLIALVMVVCGALGIAQQSPSQWKDNLGGPDSSHFSPLTQITKANVDQLQVAWFYPYGNSGFNPVMAGDMMFVSGRNNALIALDPASGKELWIHENIQGLSARGINYWQSRDGNDRRLIFTTGVFLQQIDAKTGKSIPTFGVDGYVDMREGLPRGENGFRVPNPGKVFENLIIMGDATGEGWMSPPGDIRAYDVITGKRVWQFHTIPLPGEYGYETWPKDAHKYVGGVNNWGEFSIDEPRGIVYVPTGSGTYDFWGGDRLGANVYANCLIALDVRTGKRLWHYQMIHHDLWDFDNVSAPQLVTVTQNGRKIDAVAQAGKTGFLYAFNRVTGEPLWPIEERRVPQTDADVLGEQSWPTQPFPTKPPPFGRTGVTVDDLIDFTPELRQQAIQIVSKYKMGPIFTPPVVSNINGPIATLFAHGSGGANWPGGSYDPETHRLYVSSQHNIGGLSIVPAPPELSEMAYIQGNALAGARRTAGTGSAAGGGQRVIAPPAGAAAAPPEPAGGGEGGGGLNVSGLPLGKPPYGRITAYDMDKGEILWQVAHGETPDNIRNNPALKGLNIPRTGRSGQVGTLVTKTLVIAGEQGVVTTPFGRGAMMRAYDKATGQEVGAVYLPAPESGSSMTYMAGGKQYIVIAVSGGNYSGELLAFRLP